MSTIIKRWAHDKYRRCMGPPIFIKPDVFYLQQLLIVEIVQMVSLGQHTGYPMLESSSHPRFFYWVQMPGLLDSQIW